MFGQDILTCTGRHGRRRSDLCTESLHDATAVRLLVIADLYLVNSSFQTEYFGSIGKGGAPLSGTCFGGYVCYSFLFTIVCLCQCRVQFMRTDRAYTFILEIDVCGCSQCLFQSIGAYQRGTAIVFIHFAHCLGYFNPCICLVQLLFAKLLGKDRIKIFRFQGFFGFRVQRRHGFVLHIRLYVVPIFRDFILWQDKTLLFCAHNLSI